MAELDERDTLELLSSAEIEVLGRMPWSSNATFLVQLGPQDEEAPPGAVDVDPSGDVDGTGDSDDEADEQGLGYGPRGIYKPARGERPLWDFPTGLYRREVAAYIMSRHIGWDLVPPTIERDGPLGTGSLQWFVDAEFEQHYLTLNDRAELRLAFQQLCAFDIVTNNTDRKSGHCLLADGRVWAIDNGLSFHEEFKLRTVIWDFGGQPVPAEVIEDLDQLLDQPLPDYVVDVLTVTECQALLRRARALRTAGCYPIDDTGRRWPWPVV